MWEQSTDKKFFDCGIVIEGCHPFSFVARSGREVVVLSQDLTLMTCSHGQKAVDS